MAVWSGVGLALHIAGTDGTSRHLFYFGYVLCTGRAEGASALDKGSAFDVASTQLRIAWGLRMAWTALLLSTLAVVLAIICLAANIEIFDALANLRNVIGLRDTAFPIDTTMTAGRSLAELGLDAAESEKFSASRALLFLSVRCETCNAIAFDLNKVVPSGLVVLVEASTRQWGEEWLERFGLGQHALVDVNGAIASALKISSTPTLVQLDEGLVCKGFTVPSSRQLTVLLANPPRLSQLGAPEGTNVSVKQR